MFNRDANKVYITALILLLLLTLGLLMPCFYTQIFVKIIAIKTKLMVGKSSTNRKKLNFFSNQAKVYSFLLFAFAFVPYFSLILMKDYQNHVPRFFYLYLFLFARANSVFNPIIYSTTNSVFRTKVKNLFYSVRFQKNRKINFNPGECDLDDRINPAYLANENKAIDEF